MDGLWNRGNERAEEISQARFNRMRILTVNTDVVLTNFDASHSAGLDPNTIANENGGPHFILSAETPDGRPTLGHTFALLENTSVAAGSRAQPGAGGFTVTGWRLVESTMIDSLGVTIPRWVSFEPLTGVGFNEKYHSFDENTFALRFQIVGQGAGAQAGSIHLAFVEL